jgi:hypothetical protein
MGRPSKLTEAQWLDVERRHLEGVSIRQLARDFGISPARVSERISKRVTAQKILANQLAETELSLSALPVSEQVAVRALADKLKSISSNLADAALFGSMTANKLAAAAHHCANKIRLGQGQSPDDNAVTLRDVVVLTGAANEAAKIGLNLLAANKAAVDKANTPTPQDITDLSHLSDAELMAMASADAAHG